MTLTSSVSNCNMHLPSHAVTCLKDYLSAQTIQLSECLRVTLFDLHKQTTSMVTN